MSHKKVRGARTIRPALAAHSEARKGSIPAPANEAFVEESPTQSYVAEITKRPPPPDTSKRRTKKRKQNSDTERTHSEAKHLPLHVPYEEKTKRPTLDACILRYPESGSDLEAVRTAAASYHSARTRTFTTAVCAGVMDFLDDHSRRHQRFSCNAIALLVDGKIAELERRASREAVPPPRLKKLQRLGSEWKGSTAEGHKLQALGLAWQLRVNTPEQRVAARKEQIEKARIALDKLAHMIEVGDVPSFLQGVVSEWKLPTGSRDELISRMMRVE